MVSAWSARLLDSLDSSDRRATALAAALTADQLNWHPAPGAWSIGQCLEHLCMGNELYAAAMADSLAGQSAAPVQDIRPGWFGRWFIRSFIEPSPQSKRAPAPKKIVPGTHVELSVLDRFLRSNQAVREVIRRAADLDVNRIRFRNPFLPVIRFTVGTGLEILTGHERRHLQQAERVKQSPEFARGL